ncbi:hypothetical protein [Streptomyces sp. NBC_01803]|uniref:hypothetical protein n=1 Tax=Streptomyces sp. NBC_01803 TaxID=2975946 RepID=UPI002DDB5433|nr:hypothetical protein [Streptomyces sp. NBC_01803]WSA46355.1 hypothetical protein OIE51_20500 [Streptomyces sp. NBC_01803]
MVLFLLLLLLALILGIIGVAAEGLLVLLFIGAAVLLADLVLGAVRFRRGGRRPGR